jgi:hypothetical protein
VLPGSVGGVIDAGVIDAGVIDAGVIDAGVIDGVGGVIDGAVPSALLSNERPPQPSAMATAKHSTRRIV